MVAHQTSGAEFPPGSNPASPTMILMRCRIIVSSCRKSQGREGSLPLRHEKAQKKLFQLPTNKTFGLNQKEILYTLCQYI